ncbi:MAG: nucleoside deaminase [Phycisphaerae bacterium]|nr:nucleoside deaminase [Phycisphaerae bacterium]
MSLQNWKRQMDVKGMPVADCDSRCGAIMLKLPQWLCAIAQREDRALVSVESRTRFAIELARQNVEHRTGGPFGAAVFEAASGRVVGVGVNLVEASNCSLAHAEMIAIALAQRAVGRYDLSAAGGVYELATSTEPCAMCLGAIPWSGVRRVVCGARGEDAAAIGFDEGAKPADWVGALRQRGIEVVRDVLRDEAQAVLQQYAKAGGLIYNAGPRP